MFILVYDKIGDVPDSEMVFWVLLRPRIHKGLRCSAQPVRRRRKPAENTKQGPKDQFWTGTE